MVKRALWMGVLVLILGTTAGGGAVMRLAMAAESVQIDVGFFYDRLAPYGTWVQRPPYGWVWYPRDVPPGWRPYTDGHWVWTDEYGWLWVSDWEWGWAPFHYGRWNYDVEYGWVWVPGTVWGPAWVAWSAGDGFIGWAPLPPTIGWSASIGLEWGRRDYDDIRPPWWVFCDERRFLAPRIRDVILPPTRNGTIIQNVNVRNVTNITINNGNVVNRSISVQQIQRVTGRPVPHVTVKPVASVQGAWAAHGPGNEIHVFRPRVNPGAAGFAAPPPAAILHRQHVPQSAPSAHQPFMPSPPPGPAYRPQQQPPTSAAQKPWPPHQAHERSGPAPQYNIAAPPGEDYRRGPSNPFGWPPHQAREQLAPVPPDEDHRRAPPAPGPAEPQNWQRHPGGERPGPQAHNPPPAPPHMEERPQAERQALQHPRPPQHELQPPRTRQAQERAAAGQPHKRQAETLGRNPSPAEQDQDDRRNER